MSESISYRNLKNLVDSNRIELISVVSIPRSVSTAFSRAISQGQNKFFINEAFNRQKFNLEEGCNTILKAFYDLEHTHNNEKITIVIKNMARNLSEEMFNSMNDLSKYTFFTIREPAVQISSLVTRIVNDLQHGYGTDFIDQKSLNSAQIIEACLFLENSPVSNDFSKASWGEIYNHYKSARNLNISVIDAEKFLNNSEEVISEACFQAGISFDKNKIISGWDKNYINANIGYNDSLSNEKHAWTKEAFSNNKIINYKSRTPIDPLLFTDELRIDIHDIAIPIYEKMLRIKK